MYEKRSECLNALRVASKSWPGFVQYEGLTTKTALCFHDNGSQRKQKACQLRQSNSTLQLQKPTRLKASSGKLKSSRNRHSVNQTSPSKSVTPDMADNEGQEENDNNMKDDRVAFSTNSRPYSASLEKFQSVLSSISTDSTGSEHERQEKISLSLPSVSCNELTSDDEKDFNESVNEGQITIPSGSLFPVHGKIPLRPHTAGPRMIVPPKHTGPEGLTTQDFIQGQGLNTDKRPHTSHDHVLDEGESNSAPEHLPTSFHKRQSSASASVTEKSHRTNEAWEIHTPFQRLEGNQTGMRGRRPLTRGSQPEERTLSLELTITAINPNCRVAADSEKDTKLDSKRTDQSKSCGKDQRPKVKSCQHPVGPGNQPSVLADTIEGIRKSYQRAQSAPPTHGRISVSGGNTSDSTGSGESKQFSNLYYRAKSAYHRRQENSVSDVMTGGSRDSTQTTSTATAAAAAALRGSLLRPLLYANDLDAIKHVAGCPYKCKGCFKACLVSQDYVQKAIARSLLKQQQQHLPTRSSSAKRAVQSAPASNRRYASVNIVNRALGKSQPLFQQVYGSHRAGECRRVSMKPWPRYGWVDLAARKDGVTDISAKKNDEKESIKENSEKK